MHGREGRSHPRDWKWPYRHLPAGADGSEAPEREGLRGERNGVLEAKLPTGNGNRGWGGETCGPRRSESVMR